MQNIFASGALQVEAERGEQTHSYRNPSDVVHKMFHSYLQRTPRSSPGNPSSDLPQQRPIPRVDHHDRATSLQQHRAHEDQVLAVQRLLHFLRFSFGLAGLWQRLAS